MSQSLAGLSPIAVCPFRLIGNAPCRRLHRRVTDHRLGWAPSGWGPPQRSSTASDRLRERGSELDRLRKRQRTGDPRHPRRERLGRRLRVASGYTFCARSLAWPEEAMPAREQDGIDGTTLGKACPLSWHVPCLNVRCREGRWANPPKNFRFAPSQCPENFLCDFRKAFRSHPESVLDPIGSPFLFALRTDVSRCRLRRFPRQTWSRADRGRVHSEPLILPLVFHQHRFVEFCRRTNLPRSTS